MGSKNRANVLPGIAILLLLLSLTLLAFRTRYQPGFLHHLCRYFYLLPIMATGYYYGTDAALFVALACTALFAPLLANLLYGTGLSAATIELAALLLIYNLFAALTSSLVEFDRRHRKLLDTVERLGELIGKSLDLTNLLPLILEQSMALCHADGGEIILREHEGHKQAVVLGKAVTPGERTADNGTSSRQSLLEWLAERNEIVMLSDLANDPRFDLPLEEPQRSVALLAVPLVRVLEPIGLLAIWRIGGGRFRQEDVDLLRVLADKSQMAIDNAWLYSQTDEALSRRARELSILLDTSNAVSSILDLDELLQALCQRMTESVEASFCRIYLLVEEGRDLILSAAHTIRTLDRDPGVGRNFPVDSLPWHGRAMAKGVPIALRGDDPDRELLEPERSLTLSGGAKSALLVPLTVKGRTLGLAALGEMRSWDRSPFAAAKIELCQAMAGQGALAVENILAIQSIARQSQRMQLIIDNVADGVFSTDLDRRILAFNPAAEKITGYSAKEVIGRNCAEVLRTTREDGYDCSSDNYPLLSATKPQYEVTPRRHREWIVRSDGRKVLVAHSVAPLIDQDGQVSGAVSVIRDVSREEELVRLKSEFISLVSHQLRTPLASISASAELLATRADLDEPTKRDLLQTLNHQCLRLTRLAEQVLEASRLDKGRIKLTLEPLALIPLVQGTVSMFRSRYPEHLFSVQAPERLPFAQGDKASTEVILENLLQNAVNYSLEGSRITVSTEERDGDIIVSVGDQGVGIPSDELDKVFQPFHRLPPHVPDRAHGFGLGLYIARMLAEAQGGTIWVESEPGEGSCFHLALKKLETFDEEDTAH